ncbi:MAG: 2-phospho-L-lactate guanylyltransferase [Archaeoglobus fulgidus]|uniref:2-phospho-L-lactate guanylyltransferase n=1 Tax=Archaeoglobus fulgidus TaxID=2234 RepID=A0A101DD56_ARCFL|nr:2-phospho-L-lactate guanylyltransferase [Archaeoglobus fulgidus]KUJ93381.1 MAG: 2-phospho-L-lactate guanylyltransferase [Archaeoglobus fulgidus]KUK06672.1 MAG: 2-phospho-L-lactate guanylyltransferase [Archaeoglobus fulgidus]
MRILIPFKANNPKSRLSSILSEEERKELARLMLLDVIDAAKPFGEIKVVCPSELDVKGVEVVVDTSDLNTTVNKVMDEAPLAVIMSDLPLLSEEVLKRFFETEGDVVVAPGRKGGTNMLLVRKRGFRVSYHFGSFFKHLEMARKMGMKAKIFDSFYSSVDIDDESDLLELMMHGSGKKSYEFLRKIGFSVSFEETPRLERRVFMQP